MSTEVCQIYIPTAAGLLPARAFYHTKLNGRYRARIVGIHYADDTVDNDHRLIKIKSDCFRMPFGSFTDMVIVGNKGNHTQGSPGGSFPLTLEVMGGGMDLELESSVAYNGTGNNSFKLCILTFEVEKLE